MVFPIVWVALYALMGIGAARIFMAANTRSRDTAMRLFFAQLIFNFFWSIIFFNFQAFGFAFFWLLALLALIIWMTIAFNRVDRTAALLQIPYIVWVAFAGYLNLGVWIMN